jgi:hypothetical protein
MANCSDNDDYMWLPAPATCVTVSECQADVVRLALIHAGQEGFPDCQALLFASNYAGCNTSIAGSRFVGSGREMSFVKSVPSVESVVRHLITVFDFDLRFKKLSSGQVF